MWGLTIGGACSRRSDGGCAEGLGMEDEGCEVGTQSRKRGRVKHKGGR